MAWLSALAPFDGTNQPEYPGILLDCDVRLIQGPLLTNTWLNPLFAVAPDADPGDEVHGYSG